MEWTSSAELLVPTVCSIISLPILYVQRRHFDDRPHRGADQSDEYAAASGIDTDRGRIEKMGGWAVGSCCVLQCTCIVVLGLISIGQTTTCLSSRVGLSMEHWDIDFCPERFSTVGYVYAACFSVASFLSVSTHVHETHILLVLLPTLCVYLFRDVWPLVTNDLHPLDEAEGFLLWIKIALLAIVSLAIPLFVPRPLHSARKDQSSSSPEYTSSAFSQYLYTYMDSIVAMGNRVPHLSPEYYLPLANCDSAETLRARLCNDLLEGRPSLIRIFLHVFAGEYLSMAVSLAMSSFLSLVSPIGMNQLLRYLGGESTHIYPWFWILCIGFGPLVRNTFMERYCYGFARTAIASEALVSQLIYERLLRTRCQSSGKRTGDKENVNEGHHSNGRLNNLLTVDMTGVIDAQEFVWPIGFLFEVALAVAFLYHILGKSALVGIGLSLTLIPFPMYAVRLSRSVQREKMAKTDARTQSLVESLGVIRMIKLFSWEKPTKARIRERRATELEWLFKKKVLDMIMDLLSILLTTLSMLSSYVVYTMIEKQRLDAAKIFSSLTVFSLVTDDLRAISTAVNKLIQSRVSMNRIEQFLGESEFITPNKSSEPLVYPQQNNQIGFHNVLLAWHSEDRDCCSRSDCFRLRIDGTLHFHQEGINVVVGQTGSGKTTLLMALLGELHCIPAKADASWNLPRAGSVAYASQEPWLLNKTIRENIIFGSPMDDARYSEVIRCTALDYDIDLLPAGGDTEIGEKGITLSGGQKARVSLARALYSQASVLLLDDVLAALDAKTSPFIVSRCLQGDLVKERTVVISTHNLQLLSPFAHIVVSLGNDGKISGIHSQQPNSRPHSADVAAYSTSVKQDTDVVLPSRLSINGQTKLVKSEEVQQGRVSWPAMKLGLHAFGGKSSTTFIFLSLLGLLIAQSATSFQTWFLGYWGEMSNNGHDDMNLLFIFIYTVILFSTILVQSGTYVLYTFGNIKAAESIHDQLLVSVFSATWRWFDETPLGRIISRFTKDVQTVDWEIYQSVYVCCETAMSIVTRLSGVILFSPIFAIPSMLVACCGLALGNVYLRCQLAVKREASNARSPILSHFNTTLQSLVSIRAYAAEEMFRLQFIQYLNVSNRYSRTYYILNRWIGLRIDMLNTAFTTTLAIYLVYWCPTQVGNVGFSLAMALGISRAMLLFVRLYNKWELQANSLERINDYLVIEHEKPDTPSREPPAHWPTSGDLKLENVSVRYAADAPDVLHNINLHITSGERIGIVGRTGSGKTSLILSLLGNLDVKGEIFYDGISTKNINLSSLRSKISLIPQSPELLTGTIRENLDPFSEHEDAVLNDALNTAGLFNLQKSSQQARITLDTHVMNSGGNLSFGQRQIIALARALVRDTKLLILDEATSSIDMETDSMIQTALRERLPADITVIVVAHRLQTVLDADRIVVLDSGKVVELDTPASLLQRPQGLFKKLVEHSRQKPSGSEGLLLGNDGLAI